MHFFLGGSHNASKQLLFSNEFLFTVAKISMLKSTFFLTIKKKMSKEVHELFMLTLV